MYCIYVYSWMLCNHRLLSTMMIAGRFSRNIPAKPKHSSWSDYFIHHVFGTFKEDVCSISTLFYLEARAVYISLSLSQFEMIIPSSSSSQCVIITSEVNMEEMSMHSPPSAQFLLRRWSTPSYLQKPNNKSSTEWVWYWKDNDGWKKYTETIVINSRWAK